MTKPLPRPEPSANPISGSRNVPWATIWTTAGWTSPYEEMAPEGSSTVVGTVVAAAAAVVGGAGGVLAAEAVVVGSADSPLESLPQAVAATTNGKASSASARLLDRVIWGSSTQGPPP